MSIMNIDLSYVLIRGPKKIGGGLENGGEMRERFCAWGGESIEPVIRCSARVQFLINHIDLYERGRLHVLPR